MLIANIKKISIHNGIIIFILILSGVLAFSCNTNIDMVPGTNFLITAKYVTPNVLHQTEYTSPSVIELFTSEGCSSCPPADKLVAMAQMEFSENIMVLCYHVDYWDRLGWKDPFSNSTYTDRQRQYAQHFNLELVYTPQVIVNGKMEFVGSNKSALWNAISNHKKTASGIIETETALGNNLQLLVKYNYISLQSNETVVLLLVLKNATTQVKRGENSGATLNHINIVQEMIQNNEYKGTATFNLPANFSKENYLLVAFIQNRTSFEITNAKKIIIN